MESDELFPLEETLNGIQLWLMLAHMKVRNRGFVSREQRIETTNQLLKIQTLLFELQEIVMKTTPKEK